MSVVSERRPCWGIGLGRTGTTSLCHALRILGYQSVAHNPQFEDLRNLDGGADNGITLYYKYLDYIFPESKFVLTVRDLDDWLASVEVKVNQHPIRSREDHVPIARRMTIYETVSFDRELMVAARQRHHEDVRRYFAKRPDDLLELRLVNGEGWDKLCPFLRLPIPDTPFPYLNQRG